jgi:MATE family multidrug resistance protein
MRGFMPAQTRAGVRVRLINSMSVKRSHLDSNMLLELMKIAFPMIISQGAFAMMIFTDRFFLAQLSPTHMAAAMGAGVAWFFSYSLFNGVLAYANALVAQYLGAGESGKCSKVVTQGIVLACLCIPILLLVGHFMGDIFVFMGHSPEQAALERTYYGIVMPASIVPLIKVCFASFFSGTGRTRVVMLCDLMGILINIPLAYGLIFGHFGLPALGMAGAAWGTVIASTLTVLLFMLCYLLPSNRARFQVARSLVFDAGITRRYLRLGFPSGMEMFLNVAAFNLFLLMFHSYGIAEAAAATLVFNWDILSFVPLLGLNIAVMSLTGQAVGAKNLLQLSAITRAGYVLGLGYSLLLATGFLLFREALVEMFIFQEQGAEAIRSLARFMMVGLSCYVLCEGVLQVAAGVLRGAGDTRWIMLASTGLHWLMLVSQFVLIKVMEAGPRVSWLAFVMFVLCIVVVFLWRLWGNHWRDPARLDAMMRE